MSPDMEWCREELPSTYRCQAPAEFILWGKLFKPEALGPRCYDHAAKHVGHRALGPSEVNQWAIYVIPKGDRVTDCAGRPHPEAKMTDSIPSRVAITEAELEAIVAMVSHYYGQRFTYEELQANVTLLDELALREGVHPDQSFYFHRGETGVAPRV